MKLRHITFTGIDRGTSLDALLDIQRRCPVAEFGVLASYHWQDNGNRYPDPAFSAALRDRGLHLSLHLCGQAAHDAAIGEWNRIDELLFGSLDIFDRVQLNISERKDNPEYCWLPSIIGQEVIIQQRSASETELFAATVEHYSMPIFSVLLDGSGGRGVDTPIEVMDGPYKVGYAGGIGPDNVAGKLLQLMEHVQGEFWIDMESGVRTDDWSDIRKVREVIEICAPILENT